MKILILVMKMSILIQKVRYSVTTSHPPRRQKQCHVSLRKLLELLTTTQSLTNRGLKSTDVSNQLGMTLAIFYVLFATSVSPEGETDITRHIATASHLSLTKQLESQSRLRFQSSSTPLDAKV